MGRSSADDFWGEGFAAGKASANSEIESLRAQLAEHESNQRAYEEIIGKKTYREVADQIASARKALETALRQWKMYSEMHELPEDGGLSESKCVEGEIYRECCAALKDLSK